MKPILVLFLACLSSWLQAQKNIEGLIHAEESFAADAVAHGTREAFLHFLDSSGLVFDQGRPVNGLAFWLARQKRPGILDWQPQFAEISAGGDFGYTTGPWTFRSMPGDSIAARGQYTTVWHLDAGGNWKFLADLGTNYARAPSLGTVQPIGVPARPGGDTNRLLAAERDFNKIFTSSPVLAYRRYLSAAGIISRNGDWPATTVEARWKLIAATPAALRLENLGCGLSPAGDLAYTYGLATLNGRRDNYLRIWRRERTGWKIAAEAVRYEAANDGSRAGAIRGSNGPLQSTYRSRQHPFPLKSLFLRPQQDS